MRPLIVLDGVQFGYGRRLVLDVPRLGTVNVHASLLPRHRGAAPVQWALLSGDAVTGAATVILAMGAGKTGAAAIDEYISGKQGEK